MRTGIWTPVVALAGAAEWELDAGIAEVVQVAETADRLGFDFLTCSEHVAVPADMHHGERFYDPLATFAYLAGRTEHIRLLTYSLILGLHHPLELAKRYGTLDHLSHGRLLLGVGVGNLEAEFEALQAPFADRGPRADDALRALRAALSGRVVSYIGDYYRFEDLVIDPHAVQQPVPILVGGFSPRALRRAVALGDGWAPTPGQFGGPTRPELARLLRTVDLPAGFELVVGHEHALDPLGEPGQVADVVGAWADLGATRFLLSVTHDSLEHYLDQLGAYAALMGLAST